jgi:hypothetical protein
VRRYACVGVPVCLAFGGAEHRLKEGASASNIQPLQITETLKKKLQDRRLKRKLRQEAKERRQISRAVRVCLCAWALFWSWVSCGPLLLSDSPRGHQHVVCAVAALCESAWFPSVARVFPLPLTVPSTAGLCGCVRCGTGVWSFLAATSVFRLGGQ